MIERDDDDDDGNGDDDDDATKFFLEPRSLIFFCNSIDAEEDGCFGSD